jgi:hypothetical protein
MKADAKKFEGSPETLSRGLPPRINYHELNATQKEIYNFQKVAALLAEHGFNCMKLADDWQGADFLAYHKDGVETLRVQLKAALEIHQKYVDRGLHIAFPIKETWYIIEHDALVDLCRQHTRALSTKEGLERHWYYMPSPNADLRAALAPFALT